MTNPQPTRASGFSRDVLGIDPDRRFWLIEDDEPLEPSELDVELQFTAAGAAFTGLELSLAERKATLKELITQKVRPIAYAPLTVKEVRDLSAMIYGAPVAEANLAEVTAWIRTYERLRERGLRPWDPADRDSALAFRIASDPWAQQVDQPGGQG